MDAFADRPQRVSLNDVARAAGLSKATVCRALLGRQSVAEATRARVAEAAARLGYRPDPTLSALVRHRWPAKGAPRAPSQIGIIRALGEAVEEGTRSSFGRSLTLAGARERCEELGFGSSEWILEEHPSPPHLARMLRARGVAGVVISIEGPVRPWEFPWQHFVAVTVGHDETHHPTHSIGLDWFRAVTLASSKARAAGYRRIGFAAFNRRNPEIDDIVLGAILLQRSQLEAESGPQPPVFVYPLEPKPRATAFETERDRFTGWLREHRPDVIIDTNRIAYWWLKDLGLRMPDDIGYATTTGESPHASEAHLSHVRLQSKQQGRSAVDLLCNLLQTNRRGLPPNPMRLTVTCSWSEGTTLGYR